MFRSTLMRNFWATLPHILVRETYDPYAEKRKYVKAGTRAENNPNVAAAAENRAKDYVVTDPEGKEHLVHNLARFCREHDLDPRSMHRVARGGLGSHKKWKVRKLE